MFPGFTAHLKVIALLALPALYAEQGLRDGTVSVRLSVPAWTHSSKPAAARLLLWARRAGDTDRLPQQRRVAAGADSSSLSAEQNTDLFIFRYKSMNPRK